MYYYAVIKHNTPYNEQESCSGPNEYKPTEYAMYINKAYNDGDDKLQSIEYSDSLEELQNRAIFKYVSWFNYVIGIYQDRNGVLRYTSTKSSKQ